MAPVSPGTSLDEIVEPIGARGEIDQENVERAPHDVAKKLAQRTGLERAAPDEALGVRFAPGERRPIGKHEIHRADEDALVPARRAHAVALHRQWSVRAEQASSRWAREVSVEHADALWGAMREAARQGGRDEALSHASLAAHHRDHARDTREPLDARAAAAPRPARRAASDRRR